MVISIDSLLIKQLRKLLNVILVISLSLDKTFEGNNSILENLSILTHITTVPLARILPNVTIPLTALTE